jgi:polar amino acid transport system substrate-binding protein
MKTVTRRTVLGRTLGAALATLGAGCATAPDPALVRALAPTGRLRACINLGNPILARREAVGGAPSGVSVDLARRLAEALGVPGEFVVVEAAARAVEAVRAGNADVGFFAVDPARNEGILFTAPYVIIEGAYLVRESSPLKSNDEVDRAGHRVMVGRGSAYDLFLTRELKAAQLLRTTTSQQVVERMLAEGAEVAAGVKQQLQADAARLPGLRLLPGRFMVIEQAMGLPAARGVQAQAYLRRFVEEAKASGFVAQALARHGIEGAAVAPAAPQRLVTPGV